jgi:hypothetical protein
MAKGRSGINEVRLIQLRSQISACIYRSAASIPLQYLATARCFITRSTTRPVLSLIRLHVFITATSNYTSVGTTNDPTALSLRIHRIANQQYNIMQHCTRPYRKQLQCKCQSVRFTEFIAARDTNGPVSLQTAVVLRTNSVRPLSFFNNGTSTEQCVSSLRALYASVQLTLRRR